MIKEWFYEAVINGKKYRVDCIESDGYGGSRMRTQTMTPIEEVSNEKTTKVSETLEKGEDIEESRKNSTS